jgi:2-polyprenyl-6-hydroxyphenyl methylase/3-demethylubiquinone-9 3-methyltransferase
MNNVRPYTDTQSDGAERVELRFSFGQNWLKFLKHVDAPAIEEAKASITRSLDQASLNGRSFLDIGCGSGLFSLAARQLGASVLSIDFDIDCTRCAEALKAKYLPGDRNWSIQQASILDTTYLRTLERFDVVYAWGVLHHTGNMWEAIANAASLVRVGGDLFISIYNDQGHWSKIWLRIKRLYNHLPGFLRVPFVLGVSLPREFRSLAFSIVTLRPLRYLRSWRHYQLNRGMSKWRDIVDWVGGLPFEVAKPEQVIFFLKDRGFDLQGLATCAGETGCNEYVFRRTRE